MNDSAAPSAPPVAIARQQPLSSTSIVARGRSPELPCPAQDNSLACLQHFQPAVLKPGQALLHRPPPHRGRQINLLLRVHDPGCASGLTPFSHRRRALLWMRNVTLAVING